jgi:hypothetical protein
MTKFVKISPTSIKGFVNGAEASFSESEHFLEMLATKAPLPTEREDNFLADCIVDRLTSWLATDGSLFQDCRIETEGYMGPRWKWLIAPKLRALGLTIA